MSDSKHTQPNSFEQLLELLTHSQESANTLAHSVKTLLDKQDYDLANSPTRITKLLIALMMRLGTETELLTSFINRYLKSAEETNRLFPCLYGYTAGYEFDIACKYASADVCLLLLAVGANPRSHASTLIVRRPDWSSDIKTGLLLTLGKNCCDVHWYSTVITCSTLPDKLLWLEFGHAHEAPRTHYSIPQLIAEGGGKYVRWFLTHGFLPAVVAEHPNGKVYNLIDDPSLTAEKKWEWIEFMTTRDWPLPPYVPSMILKSLELALFKQCIEYHKRKQLPFMQVDWWTQLWSAPMTEKTADTWVSFATFLKAQVGMTAIPYGRILPTTPKLIADWIVQHTPPF